MQVFILYFGFVYLQMKSSLYWLLSISQKLGGPWNFLEYIRFAQNETTSSSVETF